MSASTWIEIIGLVLGGTGGTQFVAKLTRLVVAVEQLADSYKALIKKVDEHEQRITKGGL